VVNKYEFNYKYAQRKPIPIKQQSTARDKTKNIHKKKLTSTNQ